MSHYHDPSDLKLIGEMRKAAPTEVDAWLNLDSIVGREDGAIPRKYRELIAIACALHTQCVYCIEAHTAAAKKAGVTEEELAEAAMIGAQRPRAQAVPRRGRVAQTLPRAAKRPG